MMKTQFFENKDRQTRNVSHKLTKLRYFLGIGFLLGGCNCDRTPSHGIVQNCLIYPAHTDRHMTMMYFGEDIYIPIWHEDYIPEKYSIVVDGIEISITRELLDRCHIGDIWEKKGQGYICYPPTAEAPQ